MLKCNLVIRIEHNELELYVIGNIRNPLSVLLSVNVDVVFNFNLTFVILWVVEGVWFITGFVVSDVIGSQDTAFLKVPFDHFGAEDEVRRGLDCTKFWVSVCKHCLITAHLKGAREDDSLIISGLISRNQSEVFS